MSEKNCTKVQESIVWDIPLSDDDSFHVSNCQSCFKVQQQYESLNIQMREFLNISIPENFAEKVMSTLNSTKLMRKKSFFTLSTLKIDLVTLSAALYAIFNLFWPISAH